MDDIEDDGDLDAGLARAALDSLDPIALTVDEHDPGGAASRIAAQRLGVRVVCHRLDGSAGGV